VTELSTDTRRTLYGSLKALYLDLDIPTFICMLLLILAASGHTDDF
jgi:hypothetical protein